MWGMVNDHDDVDYGNDITKMYSGKCRQVTVTLHYLSIGDPAKKHNLSLTLMMMMMMINMMHAYDKYIK